MVAKTGPPAVFAAEPDFSATALRNGVTATKAQCDAVENAVWAQTENLDQSCLRYWAAGFSSRSKQLAVPYVFFASPGMYGSSGDHMQRRRPAESRLISAGLDALKQRLGINEFVLVGQCGGGHVTASLITLRADVVCAVVASANASPRIRWQTLG